MYHVRTYIVTLLWTAPPCEKDCFRCANVGFILPWRCVLFNCFGLERCPFRLDNKIETRNRFAERRFAVWMPLVWRRQRLARRYLSATTARHILCGTETLATQAIVRCPPNSCSLILGNHIPKILYLKSFFISLFLHMNIKDTHRFYFLFFSFPWRMRANKEGWICKLSLTPYSKAVHYVSK